MAMPFFIASPFPVSFSPVIYSLENNISRFPFRWPHIPFFNGILAINKKEEMVNDRTGEFPPKPISGTSWQKFSGSAAWNDVKSDHNPSPRQEKKGRIIRGSDG
jgi:hypothetical protein